MIVHRLSNRYEIISELGRGGIGVVYKAHDPLLNREVAVKLIPPAILSTEAEQRFQREAQLVAQMDHPAVVPIYDFGKNDPKVSASAVELIKRNAQAEAKLTDELLDYSANKFSIGSRLVSLGAIVKAAIVDFTPIARAKHIEIEMDLNSVEDVILGDSLRLQQVFSNLLSNAIKFSAPGGYIKVKFETVSGCHTIGMGRVLVNKIRCPSNAAWVGKFTPLPVSVFTTMPVAADTTVTRCSPPLWLRRSRAMHAVRRWLPAKSSRSRRA